MWRACSFAIEDFVNGDNRDAFTTEYMWKIQGIVSSINSRLKLEAVAYYSGGAVDDGFCEKYAPYIDGVVFPRPDEPHHNVLRGSTLAQQLDAVTPCTEKHHIDANLLLYTGRYGTFDAPEAGYVQDLVVSDGRMELDELMVLPARHPGTAAGGITARQRSSLGEKVRDPHLRRRWERKAAACSRCLEEVRHQPAGGHDGRLRRSSDHAVVGEHDQVDVGVVEVRAQSS